jgi:ABC-type dipeptide/oligopeptide/nickel transport system permease component
MRRFVAIRFTQMLLTLAALSVAVFLSVRLTGDPALYLLGPNGSEADYLRLKQNLGLDRPLLEQYLLFVSNLAHGDFGRSYISGQPVAAMFLGRLPATIVLAAAAFAIEVILGGLLGIAAAVKRGTWVDGSAKALALLGMAVPSFWIAIVLILIFGAWLKWLPTFGQSEGLRSIILPAVVVGTAGAAGMIRLVRSSMLDVLGSEYVKFARMKGLSEGSVIYKHALRNALIPPLTFAGLQLAGLLNGTVIAEVVFGWPGVGKLMLDGVSQRDFAVVQTAVLATGSLFILVSFLVDILYAYVNPLVRVR